MSNFKVYYPQDEYTDKRPLAIALGNFDGVHIGHAELIKHTVNAKEKGLVPATVIFEEDPENFLAGSVVSPRITDNAEKAKILESLGIETVIYISFPQTRNLSPEEFVDMLLKKYNTKLLVCGFHYHFGKYAKGNASLLKELCKNSGIGCICVDAVVKDELVVSSTLIRGFIAAGEVEKASAFLGRNFSVTGKVLEGKKLGRTLGFPTINQPIDELGVIPKRGVYITRVLVNGRWYGGVTNVGVRPTVESTLKVNVETNILGIDEDLYGQTLRVEFIKMLRKEKKFASVEELKETVLADREKAQKFFEKTIYN